MVVEINKLLPQLIYYTLFGILDSILGFIAEDTIIGVKGVGRNIQFQYWEGASGRGYLLISAIDKTPSKVGCNDFQIYLKLL